MLDKNWSKIWYNLRNGIWTPFIAYIYRYYFRFRDHDGIHVMDEDWDYLIVLDACRYDAFRAVNWLDGDLTKKTSLGSATYEWRDKNFTDRYGDVVYVTANPYIADHDDFTASDHFHDVIPVYMNDEYQEHEITKPEAVTDEAINAQEEYPDKRLIIHYMQPHDPFIGEPQIAIPSDDPREVQEHFTQDESWEAYKGNLRRALNTVEDLLDHLDGKIVITGDHGDAFGEKLLKRHPEGVYTKELVEVPWLTISKGERPTTAEESVHNIDV